MSSTVVLKEIANFSDTRIHIDDVSLDNFITTDNMLQNKLGITKAIALPPQDGNMPKYQKNNILIANIRPYLKKIWFADKDGGCSADVLVLNVKDEYDAKFIYYALLRDDFFIHVMNGAKGTKMPRGDKKQIMDFLIPKFDIETQQKIAKVLSTLDKKIELNNQINQNLEAMAKTLYDYWFVQFDFPFDFAQGKPDEKDKPYKSSGGKMVYSEELKREIPEGWEVGTLDSIGNIIGGSTPSKAKTENFCFNDGMPWITPKDLSLNKGKKYITRGEYDVTDIGIKEASLKIMPKGTVLLSSRAPIGYIAISRENVTTNQGFKSFVPKSYFSTEYVYFTIRNSIKIIEANSSGSTFKEISSSVLKTIKVYLPTKDVMEKFNSKIEPVFKKQDILELETQKLTQLRDWLLPMLMNGQVSVNEATEQVEELMVAEPTQGYGA